MNKLEQAARALLAHWDTPAWKHLKPTGDLMADLREALAKQAECPHGVDDGACKECYMEQAEQEPVAIIEKEAGFETEVYATGHADSLPDGVFKLYAAPMQQAEQEPVAWRVRGYSQFKTGNPAPWRYVDGAYKPSVNNPDCCDFTPLYTRPVRTKDLTDEEIEECVHIADSECTEDACMPWFVEFARAVIAADREKNNANNNS